MLWLKEARKCKRKRKKMSDIIVQFKPKGDKELIAAINKLNVAQGGTVAATKSVTKATKGQVVAQKGLLTSSRLINTSFATMRSHMLLASFAMSLGIRQIINFTKQSAKIKQMETAFTTMAGGVSSASFALLKLQNATDGTVSKFDLLQQANNAMILGVTKNSDEMAQMFDMAQRLGDALGKDVKLSIESLVTGIGRQSRLMLDNIGIIVKADKAYEDYATELGKTAATLTDSEKKQAFMNAALQAGRDKLKFLPDEILTTNQAFQQLGAATADASAAIGTALTPTIVAITKIMTKLTSAFDAERASAYATVIKVALAGAMIFYTKQVHKAIVAQTKLGWGAIATAAGFLAAEILNMSGAFADADEPVKNLAAANMTYIQTTQMMKKVALVDELKKQELAYKGLNPALVEQIELVDELQKKVDAGIKTETVDKGKFKFKIDNEKLLAEAIARRNVIQSQSKEVSKEETALIEANIASLTEQIETVEKGFSTYESYIEIGDAINTMYTKTHQSQLLNVETGITEINQLIALEGESEKYAAVLALLEKRKKSLIQANINDIKWEKLSTTNKLEGAASLMNSSSKLLGINKKNALVAARLDQGSALINTYTAVTDVLKEGSGPMRYVEAAAVFAAGMAQVASIESQLSSMGGGGGGGSTIYGKFEDGGYVGGRRHSQGGTMIEAERGEFVMSRNAVESIGLETLNQINQGSGGGAINVSVTGNVMTQDFVEGELAEAIKEAARRGSDFGFN
jgi:hypothetical protein